MRCLESSGTECGDSRPQLSGRVKLDSYSRHERDSVTAPLPYSARCPQ
jgi:hypothetical protein